MKSASTLRASWRRRVPAVPASRIAARACAQPGCPDHSTAVRGGSISDGRLFRRYRRQSRAKLGRNYRSAACAMPIPARRSAPPDADLAFRVPSGSSFSTPVPSAWMSFSRPHSATADVECCIHISGGSTVLRRIRAARMRCSAGPMRARWPCGRMRARSNRSRQPRTE